MRIIEVLCLLDALNILKYNGVDIFDSTININPLDWVLLFVCYFIIILIGSLVEELFDNI